MENIKTVSRGELGYHLTMSCSRLECEHYRPEVIWSADKNCWPGDWEGRTILALVSLAKSTGKEPAFLEKIMELLPANLNRLGYMGDIEEPGVFSEQQFAGNSWLLRGLIEYTCWKQTDRFLDSIHNMVKNLYLPAIDAVEDYPLEKYDMDGDYSGTIVAVEKSWKLSTDIGCMYISMDGISQAYELLKMPELLVLLDKMIKRFSKSDVLEQRFQTHATLSGLRGVLRAYRATDKREYLDLAVSRFEIYMNHGMTENYENKNLFCSHKWTEPCAIVDSYMCCVELFEITGDANYIELAHRIYYNALCRVHLPNGGFVLDGCLGYEPVDTLTAQKTDRGEPVEAFWCCTMRGADGLSYVSLNQCLKNDDVLCFIHYGDATIYDGNIVINEISEFPYSGRVRLSISNPKLEKRTVKLFVPGYAKDTKVTVNGIPLTIQIKSGFVWLDISEVKTEIVLSFDIDLSIAKPNRKEIGNEYYCLWHGCLLLGTDSEELLMFDKSNIERLNGCNYHISGTDIVFKPLNDTIDSTVAELKEEKITVLLKKH